MRIVLLLSVCGVIPFILDVRLEDAPAGVTQEEGHTGFLHLPFAMLALIFIAQRIQPSLSLVGRDVEFCVPTNKSFFLVGMIFIFYFFCEEKSQLLVLYVHYSSRVYIINVCGCIPYRLK